MTNAQIIRKLTAYGISSGEVRVALDVREGKLNYEAHRETVDMVEEAIDELLSCEGHESTDGPIGNVVYCDGSCR